MRGLTHRMERPAGSGVFCRQFGYRALARSPDNTRAEFKGAEVVRAPGADGIHRDDGLTPCSVQRDERASVAFEQFANLVKRHAECLRKT
jgi:hypothetical protein